MPVSMSHAQEHLAPFTLDATYRLEWSGLKLGTCTLSAKQENEHFTLSSIVRTTGAARVFNNHQSTTKVEGDGSTFETAARVYETNYSTRGKAKHVRLTYGPGGILKERLIEPPEAEGKREFVPDEKVKAVADMLTLLPAIREKLAIALQKGEKNFQVPVFDGRRLYGTEWTILNDEAEAKAATIQPPIKLKVLRKNLAGLTAKEIKSVENDPPLTVYFSRDDKLVPLKLQADLAIGSAAAVLESPKK